MALLGSWDPCWVEDHRVWLAEEGPHRDGWRNRIGLSNQRLLEEQAQQYGFVPFYAYLPVSKRGDGRVHYRLDCSDFEFYKDPMRFRHQHGDHHDYAAYDVRFTFTVNAIEPIEVISVTQFEASGGVRIESGRTLRNVQVVRRRG